MQILLDTHALIWWLEDAVRLSAKAERTIENPENTIFVSAVVGWEIAIKVKIGKLKPASILDRLAQTLQKQSFFELPITLENAVCAGSIPLLHRDPFDRLLAAQAQCSNMTVLSADEIFDQYDIERLW